MRVNIDSVLHQLSCMSPDEVISMGDEMLVHGRVRRWRGGVGNKR